MSHSCTVCGKRAYSDYCVQHKPKKPIKQRSDKQIKYDKWIEEVARPAVIERDGDVCNCCRRVHRPHDLDHKKNKGSRPDLKRDIDNLQILGRFPCHRNKTDGIACVHLTLA